MTSGARPSVLILLLWLSTAAVLFVPGGLVSQANGAWARATAEKNKSRYGRLCVECGRAATKSARYTVSTRYYCEHHPPPKAVSFSPGWHGTGGAQWTQLVIVLVVYITIFGRVIIRAIRPAPDDDPISLGGAITGLCFAAALWLYFFVKYRFFIGFLNI